MKILILLLACIAISCAAASSCVGRCGQSSGSCSCSKDCGSNCCSDYHTVCYSCTDRCKTPYSPQLPCQCLDSCKSHQDCCHDYTAQCESGGKVTDAELRAVTNAMSQADTNGFTVGGSDGQVQVNLQAHVSGENSGDKSPKPLFEKVPDLSGIPTYEKFFQLRSLYTADVNANDAPDSKTYAAIDDFLSVAMETDVMKQLEAFVQKYNLINGGSSLRDKIKLIWFTPYSRANNHKVLGSSGFEHVFLGEVKGQEVEGFHSWAVFSEEEKARRTNYWGYIDQTQYGNNKALNIKNVFSWLHGSVKPTGGFVIGPSVEYGLASYTLCWLARPDSLCNVQFQGTDYQIQTYTETWGGKQLVGSAYII